MWKRDYKQAEAVYVAYDSEDLPLIDDINNGIDIHCRTASYITGEDYQKIYDEVQNGNPLYKFKRRFAKPVKHGTNYKMSWVKLQELFLLEGLVVTAAECKAALAAVLEASPFTVQWHKKIEAQLRDTKKITNAFGHCYKVHGIVTEDEVREGLAFGPQSTVGLMTQYAADRVYRQCDTELLMNIHDALMGQSLPDLVLGHLAQIEQLMRFPLTLHGRTFTIETDAAYGPSWGELKEVP
jgi:DNA polymerase I-like protein with 3'-5' exonuclease and polymerase domains